MKGIIAEIKGKYAVVLAQDGTFRKIPAEKHMSIGNEVDLIQPVPDVKVMNLIKKYAYIAASAFVILCIGFGAYSYSVPYCYIDVDINPSIELAVNIYDRIIRAEAINKDGEMVLRSSSLKNTKLEDGITLLLNTALEQGYLKASAVDMDVENTDNNEQQLTDLNNTANTIVEQGVNEADPIIENAVLLTVSSVNAEKSGKLKKELTVTASEKLEKKGVNSAVLVGEASLKQRKEARQLGVTPGKLVLIEDAMEDKPELKLEDLKNSAVKDLLKMAEKKKASEVRKKAEEDKKKATEDKKNSIENENKEAGLKEKENKPTGKKDNGKANEDSGKKVDLSNNKGSGENKNNNDNKINDSRIINKEKNNGSSIGSSINSSINKNNAVKDSNKGAKDNDKRTDSKNNEDNKGNKDNNKNNKNESNNNNKNSKNNINSKNNSGSKDNLPDIKNSEKLKREQLKNDLLRQIWKDRQKQNTKQQTEDKAPKQKVERQNRR